VVTPDHLSFATAILESRKYFINRMEKEEPLNFACQVHKDRPKLKMIPR
jgi:hypothetical protein